MDYNLKGNRVVIQNNKIKKVCESMRYEYEKSYVYLL